MDKCPKRNVPCEKCTETISFSDMAEHLRNECPFRLVECPSGCGKVRIRGRDLPVSGNILQIYYYHF